MKKILIGAVSLLLVVFVLLPVNRVEAGACAKTKIEAGKPQGGTAWESLHLDTSSHPEIIEYRIQWFNGGWSPWYVPGVGDLDSKTNYDGTKRLLWSYFQDHNYEIKTCDDSNTTAPVYITVESPNGGETYTDGQKITIKWKSQGVPTNNPVGVSLQIYDANNISMGNIGLVDSSSVNDGQETITLPTLEYIKKANPGLFQNIIPGQHFKILVGGSAEYGSIQDYSDNFFSISNSNNTTSNKYVNLKVNGSHNPSAVAYNSVLNVTWDSNMDSCTWWGNYVKNTSGVALTEASIKQFKPYGSEKVYAVSHGADKKTPEYSNPLQIGIQCWSQDVNIPSVSDSVNVPVNPPVVITPPVTNPSVIVLSPNGGENYKPGDKITIRWKTNNLPYNPGTQVDIMDDRIKDWSTASLFGTVPALDYAKLVSSKGGEYTYEYTFIVPQNFNGSLPSQYQGIFGGQHYKFQITISNKEKDGTYKWIADDLSDTNFNIQTTSARSITVVSPNGGENYVPGQQVTVKWTSKGIPLDDNNFHIILSKAYTTERMYLWGYNDATSKTVNDGVEVVTLPKSLAKGLYKIEISRLGSGVGDYDVYDDSDGGFNVNDSIVAYPTVTAVPSTIPKSSTYPTVVAVPTVNPITKTLRPGIKNDVNVKALQEALIKQGYLFGVADGSYGSKTFNAVKYFQAKNKLTADGLVGKTTWNMVHGGTSPAVSIRGELTPTTANTITLPTTTATTSTTTDPYIRLYGSSAGIVSDTSITVKMGDKFTIFGTPSNMQGLSYHYGEGYPGAGKYNMSYNFTQKFGDDNICGNNDATTNTTWTMSCAARALGTSDFYIQIYSNGKVYTSNKVKITIVPNTDTACTPSSAPLFKIVSPNGGEVFNAGSQVAVKWTSCNVPKDSSTYIDLVVPSMNWTIGLDYNKTLNDGEEIITLPNSIRIPELSYGKLFKMQISSSDQLTTDLSNDLFTINPSVANVPIVNIPKIKPTVISASLVTVLSPNGGESYIEDGVMKVTWKTKNLPKDAFTQVVLTDDRSLEINRAAVYGLNDYGGTVGPSPEMKDHPEMYAKLISSNGNENTYEYNINLGEWFPGGVTTGVLYGQHYKITVRVLSKTNDQLINDDQSDNNFSINSKAKITPIDPSVKTSCPSTSIVSGKPQGGTAWESLHLDTSSHPEIKKYRIQWFNGNWSPWYKPGVGDLDSKINDDGTNRLLWSYFQDHNYQTCTE